MPELGYTRKPTKSWVLANIKDAECRDFFLRYLQAKVVK